MRRPWLWIDVALVYALFLVVVLTTPDWHRWWVEWKNVVAVVETSEDAGERPTAVVTTSGDKGFVCDSGTSVTSAAATFVAPHHAAGTNRYYVTSACFYVTP